MPFEVEQPKLESAAEPPLVDVVLVSYNHENYIAQAIESVLSQRTTFRIRLLVGDDCSSDNTQAVIRSYADKNPESMVLMLDTTHRGLLSSERVGARALAMTTAKYIAMLDGDDYWTEANKLQMQVEFLEEHSDFAICFHNARMLYQEGGREAANYVPANFKQVSTVEDLLTSNFIPTCSAMFRRALLDKLPTWYFAIGIGDWPLHILNAQHGKIGYLDEVMATYRVHDSGNWSSSGNAINNRLEAVKMLERFDEHFEFRYHSQIHTARTEWYYQLAEIAYQQGQLEDCRAFFRKHLALAGWRVGRGALSLFLRAYQPTVYRALRSARGSVWSATEKQSPETAKRVKA